MGKKRKTRQEKIILKLKRQLTQQETKTTLPSTKFEPRQEAISYRSNGPAEADLSSEKPDKPIFSYDPKLVKKDILKTIILILAIFSLELVLYLKLR